MNEPTLKDVMAAIAALGARLERLEERESTSAAILEHNRAKNRERMARVRAQQSVRAQESTKEREEGKEEIPPTPPKGVKGEERENPSPACVRAREGGVRSPKGRYFTVPRPFPDADLLFVAFWEAYPDRRRFDKQGTASKYYRIIGKNPDKALQMSNVIQAALERWKKCPDWTKQHGEYVPMPSTWLNQERWLNEPVMTVGATNGYPRRSISEHANILSKEADGAF